MSTEENKQYNIINSSVELLETIITEPFDERMKAAIINHIGWLKQHPITQAGVNYYHADLHELQRAREGSFTSDEKHHIHVDTKHILKCVDLSDSDRSIRESILNKTAPTGKVEEG